jgi:hypothetical protein
MYFKNKYALLLWVFSLLSFESIGYDIYAHSIIHHFNDEKITYTFSLFIDNFIIPRYGLLSYIYEFSRNFGIPLGWVALILVYIPVLSLSKIVFNFSYLKNKIIYTIMAMMLMVLIYFYSALSLVIIWILALILTGNRFFLIGSTFHPAGFLIGLLYVILFPKIIKNIITFLAPISLMAIISFLNFHNYISLEFIDVSNIKHRIEIDIILGFIILILESKPLEFSALVIIILLSYLSKSIIINNVIVFKNQKKGVLQSSYILILVISYSILMLNSLLRDRDSLFLSIIKFNFSDNIYITWLNFGERDFVGSFSGVNNERFRVD